MISKPIYILIALIAVIFGIGPAMGYYTEYLWYDMTGYLSVFLTILSWRALLFLVGFLIVFAFIYLNIGIAKKTVKAILGDGEEKHTEIDGLIVPGAIVLSLIFGLSISSQWETILLYLNMVPAGIEDPIFSRDVSFYLFQLPFMEMIRNILLSMTIFVLIFTGILYLYKLESVLNPQYSTEATEYITPDSDIVEFLNRIPSKVLMHISVLMGLLF